MNEPRHDDPIEAILRPAPQTDPLVEAYFSQEGGSAEDDGASDEGTSFQQDVQPWLLACFGPEIAGDKDERNHRFLEEALELVQSLGLSLLEALQLVAYVYDRPIGEPRQEMGGVMVTLAALGLAQDLDMDEAGYAELGRVWDHIEKIRAKQAAKPKIGPLAEEATPGLSTILSVMTEALLWYSDQGKYEQGLNRDLELQTSVVQRDEGQRARHALGIAGIHTRSGKTFTNPGAETTP